VDCGTYIEQYLSAHVDGELSTDELRVAEEHLAGCADCRARFAEERAVKSLMRERARMLRTPTMVRGSILAALDAADNAERRDRAAGADRRGQQNSVLRRARVWVPVALAAAAVFGFVMLRGGSIPPAHAITPFDVAVDHYAQFAAHFEPNVTSNSPPDISAAYMDHKLPGLLWNLQPSGYKLVGGRIEQLRDGSPVAFTFYRGDAGTILCTYMKAEAFEPPPGAVHAMGEHNYYEYKGYRICLSYPRGGFICILVSGRAMHDFVQDIAASEL
jgi:hypothetical protein